MKKRIYKSPDGMSQINAGLWLYRGLPGSGKSTEAKKTAEEWGGFDFATDDYFTVDGEYRFDPSKLREAHQWCQDETRAFLEAGKLVCVANTFSQLWEIKPYLETRLSLAPRNRRRNPERENVHASNNHHDKRSLTLG